MDNEIVLFARLKVKPDMIDEAISAAMGILADSRRESGCINYDIHQAIDDETTVLWHETWVDKAALDDHFATPFFAEFFKVVERVAAEPPQITLSRMITQKA